MPRCWQYSRTSATVGGMLVGSRGANNSTAIAIARFSLPGPLRASSIPARAGPSFKSTSRPALTKLAGRNPYASTQRAMLGACYWESPGCTQRFGRVSTGAPATSPARQSQPASLETDWLMQPLAPAQPSCGALVLSLPRSEVTSTSRKVVSEAPWRSPLRGLHSLPQSSIRRPVQPAAS